MDTRPAPILCSLKKNFSALTCGFWFVFVYFSVFSRQLRMQWARGWRVSFAFTVHPRCSLLCVFHVSLVVGAVRTLLSYVFLCSSRQLHLSIYSLRSCMLSASALFLAHADVLLSFLCSSMLLLSLLVLSRLFRRRAGSYL